MDQAIKRESNNAASKKYRLNNKEKRNTAARARHAANPEKARARWQKFAAANPGSGRNARYVRVYGITLAQYNERLATQGGACKTCLALPAKQHLHVDHNHTTGAVRGLLCQNRNTVIGKAKESPALLRRLAEYIETYGKQSSTAD